MKTRFLRDANGTTTAEYAVVLLATLVVILAIGGIATQTIGKSNFLSSLTENTPTAAPSPPGTVDSDEAPRKPVIAPVLVLAAAALLLGWCWRSSKKKALGEKSFPSRETLDEQLKATLLALRHATSSGLPWEPTVGQFMSNHVTIVSPKSGFPEISQLMSSSRHGKAFVVDNDGAILGSLVKSDVRIGCRAEKVMQRVELIAEKHTSVSSIIRQMVERNCSVTLVVESGRPCGEFSFIEAMLGLIASNQIIKETHDFYKRKLLETVGPS